MIYICIPTHNEQQTVGVVLWKLRQVLTEFHRDYQLLVADDASTDRTTDVLEPYTRVLPLTVIRSDVRQGYAASLEMLLREAVRRSEYPRRDVIITLQADFSEEPDDVVGLIKRMEAGADVAVGIKVGVGREARLRRMARSLSSFFARRQKWPEGVVTPFDGYRAYRLQAVKRAMEDRGGRRLLRYDGWAGHAELLRAVLPHARRVDTLDVEDRPDRLQRPRRERPFASAWQVRAMASGLEPRDLVSVEELDRIAATASRSRPPSVLNGAVRAGGVRTGREGRRPADARAESRNRPDRGRTSRPERGERGERGERPPRERAAGTDATRGERTRGRSGADAAAGRRSERGRDERRRSPRDRRREEGPAAADPRPVEQADELVTAVPTDGAAPAVAAEGAGSGEAAAPKKRRRRRRSRGGASAAATGAGEVPEASPVNEAPGEASRAAMAELDELLNGLDGTGEGTAEGEAAGEKKRRRRGTRRGGRGRRRRPGSADAGAAPGDGPEGGSGDAADAVDVPRPAGEASGSITPEAAPPRASEPAEAHERD